MKATINYHPAEKTTAEAIADILRTNGIDVQIRIIPQDKKSVDIVVE